MVNHIDLFCGAGGFGLGFRNAGFEHLYAIDMDKNAVKTYNKNVGKAECGKIEDVPNTTWFEMKGGVDVITAGFPCQPFSVAGKQEGWEDGRADFYNSLLNIVELTQSKFVVFENVKRFVTHDNGNSINRLVKDMENLGYNVKFKVLNSNDYDVPQERERVIIVCNNIGIDYEFPIGTDLKPTLWDAIKSVEIKADKVYSELWANAYNQIPEGGNWMDLPNEEEKKKVMRGAYKIGGGRAGFFKRLDRNKPSPTILTAINNKATSRCHPFETRPLNIKECASIQTFPMDFEFIGSVTSKYKQIGNAIPVNLAYHIANSLKGYLE